MISGNVMRGLASTALILAAGAILSGPSPAEAAAKLVHMQNGRVIKAETVDDDGDWLVATLSGGNEIGFPRSAVARIEDDPSGSAELDGPLNVVTSGRDIGRRPPRAPGNPLAGAALQQEQQQEDEEKPEVDPNAAPAVQAPGSRIRGLMRGQPNNPTLNRTVPPTNPTGGLRSRNRSRDD